MGSSSKKRGGQARHKVQTGGRYLTKYKRRNLHSISTTNVAASGTNVDLLPTGTEFVPWQPSTWPPAPPSFQKELHEVLGRIIRETIIEEIANVVGDVRKTNGDLQYRGHVIAIAMLCAVDTLSSYAFDASGSKRCPACKRGDKVGPRYTMFIEKFFPNEYRPFAANIYNLYRNAMIHSWNLFQVTIYPDDETVRDDQGTVSFGLLNFFTALQGAARRFLVDLESDGNLQAVALNRYRFLKRSAKP